LLEVLLFFLKRLIEIREFWLYKKINYFFIEIVYIWRLVLLFGKKKWYLWEIKKVLEKKLVFFWMLLKLKIFGYFFDTLIIDWFVIGYYYLILCFRLYLLLYGLFLNFLGLENLMRNKKDDYFLGYLWERKKLLSFKSFFYICYDSFLNVVYGTLSILVSMLEFCVQKWVFYVNEKKLCNKSLGSGIVQSCIGIVMKTWKNDLRVLYYMDFLCVIMGFNVFCLMYGVDFYSNYPLSVND